MLENKTTICNRALSLIGEDPINSIEDNNDKAARVCKAHFDNTFRKVLEEGQWPEFSCEEPLEKVEYPYYSEQQKYVYKIPEKCIKIIRIYKNYNRKMVPTPEDWDFRYIPDLKGKYIICNADNTAENPDFVITDDTTAQEVLDSKQNQLVCEYVRLIEDFSFVSAKFIEALSAALAASICMDITKNEQRFQMMQQLYTHFKEDALMSKLNEEGQDKMFWIDPITASRGC